MHNNNRRFWEYVAKKYHHWFVFPRVLELGSYNVNGTVRDIFTNVDEYIGVDERPGPCVDVVCKASELTPRLLELRNNAKSECELGQQFDIVISASMLEHDHTWQQTLDVMIDSLKPHGLLLLSWGGALNDPHEQHAMEFHPLKAGAVLDYLQFKGIYVHEFHYEANLPSFVAAEAQPLRAKGFGEVVLVGFKDEADAVDLGPRSVDELLAEDTIGKLETSIKPLGKKRKVPWTTKPHCGEEV